MLENLKELVAINSFENNNDIVEYLQKNFHHLVKKLKLLRI